MKRSLVYALSIFTASAMLVSCGGEESAKPVDEVPTQETPAETPATEGTEEATTPASTEVVEFTIEANDNMQYNLDKMEVQAGQTVRVTLKNVGSMPVEAMGHNWTLFASGVDPMAYGNEAAQHKDNGFQVPGREADVLVHTQILGPGESETVEFTAPEVGIYKFACTFLGHAGLMKGVFLVK